MKSLSKAVAVASLLSAGIMSAQVANAETEYSAQIDSTYLYRGENIGGGAALFSGGADYSHESGAYAGLWVANTPEYDLYAGFAMDAGDVSIDVGAITYVYPGDTDAAPLDGVEAYLNVGFMGASLSYNVGLESLEDSSYIALGYEVAGVSLTYGIVDDGFGKEFSHIDASYGLTDELSITVSQAMDDSDVAKTTANGTAPAVEDMQIVVSYTLPIK